jgi:ABC-type transport system involved in multi-copper enzyme maturation permease subunit
VSHRIAALAWSTFRETVRDRIFYLVGVFGFVMLASTAVLSPLTVGAQGKIMSDVGLAGMSLFGLLVVVFVGSGMVRKEMDKGTIVTILAKPVGRREYLVGKYLGLNLTLTAMLGVMALMFALMLLVAPGEFSPRFLGAVYLSFLELSLVNAVAVFFSTCVSPVLAAVFTLGAFVVGHLSASIRAFGQLQAGPVQTWVSEVVYHLVPNLEVFNVRGAMVHGDPVGAAHFLWATVYGLGWTVLLLLLAGGVFARRELRG